MSNGWGDAITHLSEKIEQLGARVTALEECIVAMHSAQHPDPPGTEPGPQEPSTPPQHPYPSPSPELAPTPKPSPPVEDEDELDVEEPPKPKPPPKPAHKPHKPTHTSRYPRR